VIKVEKGGGKIYCVGLEPLTIDKKEELYFNFLPKLREKGYTDYAFLDKLNDEYASTLSFQYSNYIYMILLFIVFIIFIIYLYKKMYKGNLKTSIFIVAFLTFCFIFSFLFYFSIGKNIINNNNVLSEIAIIEMKQDSKKVFVESYYSFLSHFDSKSHYYMERRDGFLDGIVKNSPLEVVEDFQLQNNRISLIKQSKGRWKTGQFKAYYRSELPLEYELINHDEHYIFSLNNNSQLDIKYLSIYYDNQWFYAEEIKSGGKTKIDLSNKDIGKREYRSRRFFKTVNMTTYLSEAVLNEVIDELTNYRAELEKRVIIFGLLEGEGLTGSVKFNKRGNRLFSGVFYLPLQLRGE
jgi:hypothetical protein